MDTALKKIESLSQSDVVADPSVLKSAVGAALAPPAPGGSPTQIYSAATAYRKAAERYGQAFDDLRRVHTTTLPAAWKSPAADKAAQHIQAVGIQIQNTVSAFGLVSEALMSWSDALQRAQSNDQHGRELLTQAGNVTEGRALGLGVGVSAGQALQLAADGCSLRQATALELLGAASTATMVLTQTTAYARAQKVVDAGPLTATLLSTAQNPDGTQILSLNAITVGEQRWEALSTADRTALEGLLASSVSSQEAAYMWKALAAGNSVKTIEAFDKAIRPHATSPQWLADHLTPDLAGQPGSSWGSGDVSWATYKGKSNGQLGLLSRFKDFALMEDSDIYNQGKYGDCVAASTVVARANVDPVYMLGLTTGFGEPVGSNPPPGDDSPAAFHARLQHAYIGEYRIGQAAEGDKPDLQTGIGSKGENVLANRLLAPATSTPYHYQSLSSPSSRAQALPEIEANAADGVPVPIDVQSSPGTPTKDFEAHQVVVTGYKGGKLQIVNPWGFTQNDVDPSKFVDGKLPIGTPVGGLSLSTVTMPDADGVEMPGD
ncbi:hypothetical protein [Nocardia sp. GAS34]|uniref:hypothetical protein n=1 Tax=unclassified Nocardia TaxID=2637762 RepID=UPI003D1B7C37